MENEEKNNQTDIPNHNWGFIEVDDVRYRTLYPNHFGQRKRISGNPYLINALIPGTIREIFVKKGQKVKAGEKLLLLEAMKMNNQIVTNIAGTIDIVHVSVGDVVPKDTMLITLKP